MAPPCNRRDFLKHTLAGLGMTSLGAACSNTASRDSEERVRPASKPDEPEALYRISLAEWSLHRRLFGDERPVLDHLDFASTARRLGIGAVEYVNTFFKTRAEDQSYLREMKRRADGEGVKSLLIMCDGEGDLGAPDLAVRMRAVESHHKWVEAAAFLDCHSIRVNARSEGSSAEQAARAADGLSRLTEFASERDINVIVENHGGLSSSGAWLSGVMKRVGHPRCGTLPDFGNFRIRGGEWYDRYQGVEELMPYAKAVSAKSFDFDEEGNEITTDYLRMMKIVVVAGYRGHVGIEYEGKRLSEEEGIRATKSLLLRVRAQLTG
jgi:sugar phosphate isomerase/epimerase